MYRTRAIITPFLKSISLFSRRFFGKILSLCMVSIQELFLIKSGLWWRMYGRWFLIKLRFCEKATNILQNQPLFLKLLKWVILQNLVALSETHELYKKMTWKSDFATFWRIVILCIHNIQWFLLSLNIFYLKVLKD